MINPKFIPCLIGALFVGLMLVIIRILTGKWSPLDLARGDGNSNGALSASKLQNLIFTFAAVFAYTSITSARLMGDAPFLSPNNELEVPANLILLMGLSALTAISSKAITVSYLKNNRISQEDKSSVINGRNGKPDLVKVQMILWTMVAVCIYLAKVARFLSGGLYADVSLAMPDVDNTLIALMGVSQTAYIGNKLAAQDAP